MFNKKKVANSFGDESDAQGVNINHFLYPKTGRAAWGWRNRGQFQSNTGLSGPEGTGIAAYSSPFAPEIGAAGPVLFGSRSRVGF